MIEIKQERFDIGSGWKFMWIIGIDKASEYLAESLLKITVGESWA